MRTRNKQQQMWGKGVENEVLQQALSLMQY